jgi:diguanylate cyclase (GGDEF)-like protein
MSERDEFEKAIENLIDQMIALLPEEMQSTVRKQLAHQREVAWMARAEATKAQEEQKRLEAEAKIAADSAEQELMRLLVSSLSRHLGQTDPGNVKNDVELILKLNEKYTEFEVAKAKCRKDLPSDGIDRDHLTGLFNTQYLNKILIEEIARSEDHQTPLTMLMIDIDDLKRVNYAHGHTVGNVVLKSVADVLRSAVRPGDFVFRTGGDEFSILLPGTDLKRGLRLGEEIGNRIETSDVAPDLAMKITLTVVACEYETGEGKDRFMRRLEGKRDDDDGMSSVRGA